MKVVKIIGALIALFISLPLYLFMGWLLYSHVKATELMWFLFWFSTPFTVLTNVIFEIAKVTDTDKN